MPKILINNCVEKEFDVVIYVDPVKGLDTNDGLTELTAVNSFNKAVELNKENTDKISACVFLTDTTILYDNCNFKYLIGTDMCKVTLSSVKMNGLYQYTCIYNASGNALDVNFIACTVIADSSNAPSDWIGTFAYSSAYYGFNAFKVTFTCCSVNITCKRMLCWSDQWTYPSSSIQFYNCTVSSSIYTPDSSRIGTEVTGIKNICNYDNIGLKDKIDAVDISVAGKYSTEYGIYSCEYFVLFNISLPEIIKSDYLDKIEIKINNKKCYVNSLYLVRKDEENNLKTLTPDFVNLPCFYKDTELNELTKYEYIVNAYVIFDKNFYDQTSLFKYFYFNTTDMIQVTQTMGGYRCYTTDSVHSNDYSLYRLFNNPIDLNFGATLPCIYLERNLPFLIGGIHFYKPDNSNYCPKGFVIRISENGYDWKTVFTEPDDSTRLANSQYIDCNFGKNYRVRYVLIKITSRTNNSYLFLKYFAPYYFCNS